MASAKLVAMAAFLVIASAHSIPQKFKPLVDACEGLAAIANCTAHFDGVCKTHRGGERSCHQHQHLEHTAYWKGLRAVKRAVKRKLGLHGRHSGWHRSLGDCGSKRDGEACTVAHAGRCIDSGKCPVFHGELVCKPWDAHPPEFITRPCSDKEEGQRCKLAILPGTCKKAGSEDLLVCDAWPFGGKDVDGNDDDEAKEWLPDIVV
mmetsp:Transcript_36991/g.102818  ORF Transcript_36991/g.102818 Transcript_36991/m.102818 type:complete len:205 (-) Transcript_36991:54-668(-)